MATIKVSHGSNPSKKLVINPARPQQFIDSVKKTIFIVGSFLVILAAARNTLTWYLQHLWGVSGNFWQNRWRDIYDLSDGDACLLGLVGTFVVTFGVFWFFNLMLICVDATGKPAWFLQYKVQPDQNVPVDRNKLKKAVLQVLFNQIFIGAPVGSVWVYLMVWRGSRMDPDGLPTFQWFLIELVGIVLVEELMFYYSHRLLHHPRLYKYIHKKHHEWTAPIGIISLYAHPVEHAISNILPPLAGPLLLGSHLGTAWLWFSIALMSTTVAHCGYHLPFFPSPESHDFHHLKFNNNFGVLGVLDRLHGTDEMFRASKAYERHIMLLGFKPLREEIPDPKQCRKD